MKNAMITGASGMIGQLVLAHCLASDEIEQVSVIVRKPLGIQHPKLKEVVHHDFYTLKPFKMSLPISILSITVWVYIPVQSTMHSLNKSPLIIQ